ncbi:hypothetical protein GCM10011352_40850 [Marinobacterium zhoushanense]|uniref:Transposase n=1 Tax=Marinobacterium zhoushanense TaxID=1679163 RepID=A0ABQ1KU67_9GAMM|nr:hypothetical protein GCM10011352_40850 [Marinobacterium zhoushanense]
MPPIELREIGWAHSPTYFCATLVVDSINGKAKMRSMPLHDIMYVEHGRRLRDRSAVQTH